MAADESRILRSLLEDEMLIIKPADKGGSIVVMDRPMYIKEVERQLSDTTTYEAINHNPTFRIKRRVQDLVNKYAMLNVLDKKMTKYLINDSPIIPVFYVLPKVHKCLQNPPGRPIVASTEALLTPLSVVLDKLITPLVKTTKSFLLDTSDFLGVLQNMSTISKDCWIVTIDVVNLYTSIDHHKGIKAGTRMLRKSTYTPFNVNLCWKHLRLYYVNIFSCFVTSSTCSGEARLWALMWHPIRKLLYGGV